MNIFELHTIESAPESSKNILESTKNSIGFIPNMHSIIADSPILLKAYKELGVLFNKTSFTPVEREIIEMTINKSNGCSYCIKAHSYFDRISNFPTDILNALISNTPFEDNKLESLRLFTQTVIDKKGWILQKEVEEFLAAGYTKTQILELLVAVAHKTISNYVNHIADTPIDKEFEN